MGESAWEMVWPLLGASGRLSAAITCADHSIVSAYQSNCINGYRRRSRSVINQRDGSNVPKHQASLKLQAIENHSQQNTKSLRSFSTSALSNIRTIEHSYYRTFVLSDVCTIEQTYYRTPVLSNQVSLQLQAIENHSQESTKSVWSFTGDTIPYQDQHPITIMISITIRSRSVSASKFDQDSYQDRKMITIRIRTKNQPES